MDLVKFRILFDLLGNEIFVFLFCIEGLVVLQVGTCREVAASSSEKNIYASVDHAYIHIYGVSIMMTV